MIEHIVRRLRGAATHDPARVMEAAREFTRPLLGSSASTLVIFAPLAFLSGVTGPSSRRSRSRWGPAFSSPSSSLAAVPLLADRLLNEKDASQKEGAV